MDSKEQLKGQMDDLLQTIEDLKLEAKEAYSAGEKNLGDRYLKQVSSLEGILSRLETEADRMHNLASATAVIAFHLGYHKRKLGRKGVMLHYDIVQDIAKAFCVWHPHDFDWENSYIEGGEDRDVVCEQFTDDYIKENSVYVDENYYN